MFGLGRPAFPSSEEEEGYQGSEKQAGYRAADGDPCHAPARDMSRLRRDCGAVRVWTGTVRTA